jgi:activator of 2-hydroxyglutaryl-CoA dehydratase
MGKILHIGLDVGSTTVKIAVLDENDALIFSHYQRHFSDVQHTVSNLLQKIYAQYKNANVTMNVTGSSGMTTSEQIGVKFIQEVIACSQRFKDLFHKPMCYRIRRRRRKNHLLRGFAVIEDERELRRRHGSFY